MADARDFLNLLLQLADSQLLSLFLFDQQIVQVLQRLHLLLLAIYYVIQSPYLLLSDAYFLSLARSLAVLCL